MSRHRAFVPAWLLLLGCAVPGASAQAPRAEPMPKQLEGVEVTERPDSPIPLKLEFTDEDGRAVRLGDYFKRGRPVILTLGYYECPMLCTLVLNGLIETLKTIEWTPGLEYEIVTVTINPAETYRLARLKKENYLTEYGRAGAAMGWHFLTGREENIKALAGAVGFGYKYDERIEQYAHPAVIIVTTPEGHVSRYLYGIKYEPKTLRLALVEASEGKIGSTVDQVILYCYHYDAAAGRYAPAAMKLMRIGGVATLVTVAGLLAYLWIGRSGRRAPPAGGSQS
ncbi:MAG: SCO family protein [Acidobacteriota bacterium]